MKIDINSTHGQKIDDYVIFPRYITRDFRDGKMSKDEFLVYSYLRVSANPYGVMITSISSISEDLFTSKKSINYTNKVLLGLKNKRYIYYEKRSGRRGSFNINFPDFILPNKTISSIWKLFEKEKSRGLESDIDNSESEVTQNTPLASQRLDDIKIDIKRMLNRN